MSLSKMVAFFAMLTVLSLWAGTMTATAQDKYPSRQIEFVVPWPPGGATDIAGRIYGNELSKVLKVPVVPVNKAGASATVGGTYVFKAKRDGYTLLCGSQGFFFGSLLLDGLVYDPLKDFVPILNVSNTPHTLCVKKDSPYKTLEDFIEKARKNPKMVSVGTAGLGSDGYFNLEVLLKAAGIQIKHVPYKGIGEVPPAVMGGHVELGIGTGSAFFPFVRSGDMRILGLTGVNRMKEFSDVPTFSERGFKGRYFDNWTAPFAPAGLPQPVIDTLIEATEKVLKSKEYAESIEKSGGMLRHMTHVEFVKGLEEDRKVVESIAKELGLKK
jgi:tripartite-type tricarboxylate transporter receptor subunit TctC